MKKFKDKFRIESTRLQSWDYSWQGDYFITICVKDRNHRFGKIINGAMQLNELGIVAHNEWLKTPDIRPDMNIHLGEFVVMPDHFHGIVTIGENEYNTRRGGAMHGATTTTESPNNVVETSNNVDEKPDNNIPYHNDEHQCDDVQIRDDEQRRDDEKRRDDDDQWGDDGHRHPATVVNTPHNVGHPTVTVVYPPDNDIINTHNQYKSQSQ